jgi:TfoX/Sxy family transcriptional regulator of competence genes
LEEKIMATTPDYMEYVAEKLEFTGRIRYRKMFGEYMVYINEKPLVLVCDNTAFVKILPCLETIMSRAERGYPYEGAKEHYVLDTDDSELVEAAIAALDSVTEVPKPKVRKRKAP